MGWLSKACHGLASICIALLYARLNKPGASVPTPAAGAAARPSTAGALLQLTNSSSGDGAAVGASASTDDQQAAEANPNSTPEQNEKHRRIAGAMWDSKPLHKLLLVRLSMEPLRQLKAAKMRHSKGELETDEEVVELKRLGGDVHGRKKEYALVTAARGTLEDRFGTQLGELWSENHLWLLLPKERQTEEFRSLTFAVMSKLGCLVCKYLVRGHKSLTVQLFQLLFDASLEIAQVLLDEEHYPACIRTDWVLDFLRTFDTPEKLCSRDALAHLRAIAVMAKLDNAMVERIWARIRRLCLILGTGTNRRDLEAVSADNTIAEARLRRDSPVRKHRREEEKKKEAKVYRGKKRKWAGTTFVLRLTLGLRSLSVRGRCRIPPLSVVSPAHMRYEYC
jgi:hypothetical protein